MGYGSRNNVDPQAQQAREFAERFVGPVQPWNHYTVCPKCLTSLTTLSIGTPATMKRSLCHGKIATSEELSGCEVFGEHFHSVCLTCNFLWREACADAPDVIVLEGSPPSNVTSIIPTGSQGEEGPAVTPDG